MGKYRIKGGRRLSGEIEISGAKNAALPILAASVITGGENMFISCPEISDVRSMLRILEALGCRVCSEGGIVTVNASGLSQCSIPPALMKEMRSSVFLAGSLLARCGEATISDPGGCNIGERPIDIHIRGLEKLGASVETKDGLIRIKVKGKCLKGCHIRLNFPSVGATENLLLAAIGAEGTTVIENSAREPEIVDLQRYINKCGGCVKGAGTGRIEIEGRGGVTYKNKGVPLLKGCMHKIMPDRIEGGTYLLMAAGTDGDVFLNNITALHEAALVDILQRGGYSVKEYREGIRLRSNEGALNNICEKISTAPYPGFPTDMQPQITAFLTKRGRGSVVEENIFENRFGYAKQLIKIGADIEISQKQVIIKNNNILYGGNVYAEDLRGGAALVVAGLMAEGDVIIDNTKYIERGYGKLEEKIKMLGGEISRDE